MRKLWMILFFGHLEHLPEKNNLWDSFLSASFTIFQKKSSMWFSMWFSFFASAISPFGLVNLNFI